MISSHKPPRGQKPAYVFMTFQSWDAFERITILDNEGPTLSVSSEEIRLDCNKHEDYKSSLNDDGSVSIIARVPRAKARIKVRCLGINGNQPEHPQVVWMNPVHVSIDKMKHVIDSGRRDRN